MVVAKEIRVREIPTIDLVGGGKDSNVVSKLIVEACEEYGLFKVVNHGVPHQVIKRMEDESFEFFLRKSLPDKQRVAGYGNKKIGLSGDTGDLEYLLLQTNIHNSSTPPSNFSYTVNGYIAEVRRLACEILSLMAKGLGLPLSVFTTLLTDIDTDSLLRLNHYPPSSVSTNNHIGIGFGEHSDPQILTLLTSNHVPGLQLSLGNGHWLPVTPDPQAFCVIVGDLLQAMTNGRFVSARHRAMANTSCTESRLSMVFFGGPPPQTTISCPPQLLKPGNKPIYKPFTWAQYKSHTYAHTLGETRLDHFKLN